MKYLRYEEGRIRFNGVEVLEIIKKEGTPIKIFNPKIVVEQFEWLRKRLHENIIIGYSTKSNPDREILNILKDKVSFFTVIGERDIRNYLGYDITLNVVNILDPTDTSFYSLENTVWVAHTIEQYEEFKSHGARVMLRFNHHVLSSSLFSPHISRFGMERDEIIEISNKEDVEGVHAHLASQAINVEEWRRYFGELRKLIKDARVSRINIGGGFPYPYTDDVVLAPIIEEINRFSKIMERKGVEVMIEPGRFLSAPSRIGVMEVLKVIDKGDCYIAITNASCYNMHPDIILVNEEHKLFTVHEKEKSKAGVVRGITMDSVDLFSRNFEGKLKKGDLLVIEGIGAYNFHSTFFNLPQIREVRI